MKTIEQRYASVEDKNIRDKLLMNQTRNFGKKFSSLLNAIDAWFTRDRSPEWFAYWDEIFAQAERWEIRMKTTVTKPVWTKTTIKITPSWKSESYDDAYDDWIKLLFKPKRITCWLNLNVTL